MELGRVYGHGGVGKCRDPTCNLLTLKRPLREGYLYTSELRMEFIYTAYWREREDWEQVGGWRKEGVQAKRFLSHFSFGDHHFQTSETSPPPDLRDSPSPTLPTTSPTPLSLLPFPRVLHSSPQGAEGLPNPLSSIRSQWPPPKPGAHPFPWTLRVHHSPSHPSLRKGLSPFLP